MGRKEKGRKESENACDMEREGPRDGEARDGGIGADFSGEMGAAQRSESDSGCNEELDPTVISTHSLFCFRVHVSILENKYTVLSQCNMIGITTERTSTMWCYNTLPIQ